VLHVAEGRIFNPTFKVAPRLGYGARGVTEFLLLPITVEVIDPSGAFREGPMGQQSYDGLVEVKNVRFKLESGL
jgi:hypothetical protein